MNAIIIAGGSIENYSFIKQFIDNSSLIICADSGYDHALNLGLKPSVVIGDMDSIKSDLKNTNAKVKIYSPFKDNTDTELAIDYAISLGVKNIILFAGLGDRIDHCLGNIFLIKKCLDKNVSLNLISDNETLFVVDKDISFNSQIGKTLSLIPLDDCSLISTSGLKYSLDKENLLFGSCRGISNIVENEKISIKLKSGHLLVCVTHKLIN